ncbi:PHD finger protein 20 [Eumeta japonica]|uniref:PHD finger protein 20 n=1 Tax=Eumeta variegata TaxID=151549 RepID=A0A4C1UJ68_EUMVA|nr:PHD finger protein 20 [Eumeta japonica]
MKREEIINCHCGFREEDGLMIQCELCLCWQHALCHNIQRESEVPEKYTCSICLNPRGGRRSQRFLHDQDRLYEGLLPGARPDPALRRAHELSGNLLRFTDALHALRVKYYVATKKNHPKLYLWAKDWENGDISNSSEAKLNSDYLHLSNVITDIGKENLPIRTEDLKNIPLMETRTPSIEEDVQRREGQLVTQLTSLLSSPSGPSLDIPISTTELEHLAKSVQAEAHQWLLEAYNEAAVSERMCREWFQKFKNDDFDVEDKDRSGRPKICVEAELEELLEEDSSPTQKKFALTLDITQQAVSHCLKSLEMIHKQEYGAVGTAASTGPQPEAAIEDGACRERLLRHVQRCQALIDARLDSIEAQVAELESQDPSFEDDETADYFPRTKQTIQMLLRDMDNMEELGFIS